MLNFGPTFIWAIINLIVLYVLLKKVLFKPVTQLMENRTNSIVNDLERAKKVNTEAEHLKMKYEDSLKAAKIESDAIIKEARIRGEKEYNSIVTTAKNNAEDLVEKARIQIELEREQMLKEVKAQVAGLALAAASKVLEANMDTEANRTLVDKFLDEAGAA